ncbi:fimbrial biogenesis chaperone [Deinococcus daejeonensis]|uniref:Pili assembly chaperone N-terminal domain-containing protein n=1 Tax=Deinococcus daejeonensis TaxID=1007098 RepID=A0ABQ2J5B9_9DEIO|nr:fimbria/pilus periplasmic chaperone [Deinococcus daejeonensis]GGN40465.1 hypothetical protein GCM10010842_25330 [Deinococcus daejeonensis]
MKRLILAALATLGLAEAQSFSISPTGFYLNPANTNTAQVRVQNPGTTTMSFTVEVRRWTTENGKHVYAPTRDVVVNPSSFTLKGGDAQVLRVGLLKKGGAAELTYRVFLQQVPSKDSPVETSQQGDAQMNLTKLIRMSLPVYVTPPSASPRVSFRAHQDGTQAVLDLVNTGSAHQTYRALSVQVGGRTVTLGSAAVLGTSTLSLPLGDVGGAKELSVLYRDTEDREGRVTVTLP